MTSEPERVPLEWPASLEWLPDPPQRRGRVRRDRIVSAAWDAVNEYGHRSDLVSVREISRRSETAVGTIYHYFSDLDQILGAVAGRYLQELVDASKVSSPKGEWRDVLDQLNSRFQEFFRRYPRLRELWFDDQASTPVRLVHLHYRELFSDQLRHQMHEVTDVDLPTHVHVTAITIAGALIELAFTADPNGDGRVFDELGNVMNDYYARHLTNASRK